MVSSYVNVAFADKPIADSDRELLIRFYKCECFGMVMEWMSGGLRDDMTEQIRRLCELRRGMAEEMVERSLKQQG